METWKGMIMAARGDWKSTLAAMTEETMAYNANFYAEHCCDCKVNPETGENTYEDPQAVSVPMKCLCCDKYMRRCGYHKPYAQDDSNEYDPCIKERPTLKEVGEIAANNQVEEVCQRITKIINGHRETLKKYMQNGEIPVPGKWTRIHNDSMLDMPLIKEVLDLFVEEGGFAEESVMLQVWRHASPEVLSVDYGW